MQAASPATEQRLRQLAANCTRPLRLETDAHGVHVELVDAQLRFYHSFLSGSIGRRARQADQLLLKACNNRQRGIRSVLDLTAGWGVDGYILARHGQQVTMLEQNELLRSIVAWSLQCLAQDAVDAEIARRLLLEQADSLQYLRALTDDQRFDCIYLDPMFPAHKSGAKPAKEMQILQALTGNSSILPCFELALRRARNRVVVKRGAKAPALSDARPDLVHKAKSIRFDVYLVAG